MLMMTILVVMLMSTFKMKRTTTDMTTQMITIATVIKVILTNSRS